ncbi:MAG TPA: histone deacetylase family protein [Longimicrobiales bacterium]|nr:histone deacetylase family protein [Longimicrobiales bacterium]
MLRIRRIYDTVHRHDRAAVEETQRILRDRFPEIPEARVAALPDDLRRPNPDFRAILFVAQSPAGRVRGFALMRHAADLNFAFLDFIAAARGETGGIGGALYERVREEAAAVGCTAVFFEVAPDTPELESDPKLRAANRARIRFYEAFGARPIAGTDYETPVEPGGGAPLLVYDPLTRDAPLGRSHAKRVVRAILARRYGDYCPPAYVDRVVASFRDDPVRLRAPLASKADRPSVESAVGADRAPDRIALVVNDSHDIHHIRERGYVEAPVRVGSILRQIEPTGWFHRVAARDYPDSHVLAVHDADYVRYLKTVCEATPPDRSVYPYVFPIRNVARPPKDLAIRAGYYCIDTFTPLNRNAYRAARAAVDCALTAADEVLGGSWMAYALVRPPGHHAERRAFGGFCYFGTAAIAANHLSAHGTVAMLDVDYHHGNSQQDIFWERGDVLTLSIHGDPAFAYPYFSGFPDETGVGAGAGSNLNLPLPESVDGERYARALGAALRRVREFDPRFLVVALGLDTAKNDPTGSWSLGADDFERNGRMIGSLGLPTLVVQEGGYRTRTLGVNARRFFQGLREGARSARANPD